MVYPYWDFYRHKKLNTMKTIKLLLLAIILISFDLTAQTEYKVITSVESIVPNGLGRSRLISSNDVKDYKEFTSTQTADDNTRNKSKRDEIRVRNFDETKLLNFYNLGGIRFQNIAANDALITSKLNAMSDEGWELMFVTSGVESKGDKSDNNGIFITRYVFKRTK
jgi:hypothetical protein